MVPLQRAAQDIRWKGYCGVMGTQMGKTDSTANIMGCFLDDSPVPLIYMAPTRHFCEKKWEPRFVAMVQSADSLSKKYTTGKTDSKTQKNISGVTVSFAWAGSATALAGDPAGHVIVDERDRMVSDVEGEGDPVELANARHETYPDGKTGVFSTPTTGTLEVEKNKQTGMEHWAVSDEVSSPTWEIWQQGTRHEWMWPCPNCDKYFAPRFRHLWWPEDSEPGDLTPDNVLMTCPHCGEQFGELHKNTLNDLGIDIAPGEYIKRGKKAGKYPKSDWYTLWVSGLCSPWRSWTTSARRYLRAAHEGSSEKLQAIVNTCFGELYSVSGEAPPWEDVAALRLDYSGGTIPEDATVLTMSVDVQMDSLYYVIRGWSRKVRLESWLIESGQLFGDTMGSEIWEELAEFRTRLFGDGKDMKIKRMFVDQKYRAQQVFAFCRTHRNWAFPVAGRLPKTDSPEAQRPLHTSSIEVGAKGEILKGGEKGLMRWTLNTDFFKRFIHDQIAMGPKAKWHLSSDADEDYCKQIVAEARIVKPNGRVMWIQSSRDNHYLDCEMMAVGCAYSLRLQHYGRKGSKPELTADADDDTEVEPPPSKPSRRKTPVRRKRKWSSRKW